MLHVLGAYFQTGPSKAQEEQRPSLGEEERDGL